MPKRITQIPFPGSSGQTPTGAMQFQDDWPGLFVRGDVAIFLSWRLRYVLDVPRENGLEGEMRVLSAVPQIEQIIKIIEEDVRVRPDETA